MAKEELIYGIKINVDGEEQVTSIKEAMTDIEDSVRNLSKANASQGAEENFKKLNKVVDTSVLSIQELGVAIDNYKNIAIASGKESPIGKEAIKKAAELERQLQETQQSVANLSAKGQNLNASLQLAGGVVAGYTAFQSVTQLVGTENEKVVESIAKLQSAMGLLVSIEQIRATLEKQSIIRQRAQALGTFLLAKAQLVYTAVSKKATIGTKSFGKALIATGIGAIVVALGFLLANLEEVGAFFKWVGEQIYQYFKPPIDLVIKALQLLGIMESDTAKASRQASEIMIKASEERRKEIDKLIEANKRQTEQVVNGIDFEIRKRKASGKDVTELELKKLKTLLFTAREERKLQFEKIKRLRAEIKARILLGDITEEQAEEFKTQTEESIQALRDSTKAQRDAEQNLVVFKIEQQKKLSDASKKVREENKKAREKDQADEKKKAEDHAKELEQMRLDEIAKQKKEYEELLAFRKMIADAEIYLIADKFERERATVEQEFEQKLADLEEQNLLTSELEFQLLAERNEKLKEIDEKQKEEEKARDEKALKEKLENQAKFFDKSRGYINALSEINQLATTIQLKEAGDNEQKKEQIRKENFKREKALNLATATINGAQAVLKGFAEGGIAGGILAGITAVTQIGLIASATYQGAGGGASGGQSAGSVRPSTITGGQNQQQQTDNSLELDESGSETPYKQKVVLVSHDVTNAQKLDNKVKTVATF